MMLREGEGKGERETAHGCDSDMHIILETRNRLLSMRCHLREVLQPPCQTLKFPGEEIFVICDCNFPISCDCP